MISGSQLRKKYLDFFAARGHQIVPSAPLVPENDPTTLFTGSGMQPMITYLLGQPHPLGTRIVDSQKCFRSQDIEEVGDNRHITFFEMLGNWSLGDYFKTEQLHWVFEFLTQELGLDPRKLYVSVFAGDPGNNLDPDAESISLWQEIYSRVGINAKVGERIFQYPSNKNWWSRSGVPENMPEGEPGGPDSEIFYEFTSIPHDPKFGEVCNPNCDCGRFLEIGNSVFMTFRRTSNGFVPLEKKNIDFGGGLERILAAMADNNDVYATDLYAPIIKVLETQTATSYSGSATNRLSLRVIADHLKSSSFLIADGVFPSNKAQGYFLRRLLRRAAVKLQSLSLPNPDYSQIIDSIIDIYKDHYTNLYEQRTQIIEAITQEHHKFAKTLVKGLREFNKLNQFDGKVAFDLFQTYGFPLEITVELAREKGLNVDEKQFADEFSRHKDLSRTASQGMFKGGLQDHSEITTKYHTATHLLHKALRVVLGDHVQQKGSNITSERLRFDFSHPEKVSSQDLEKIEKLVNEKIVDNLPVHHQEIPKSQALSEGALAFFAEKYPNIASVYTIGDPENWFSKELCGGPHVSSTGEIGRIKIVKEESAGSGIRRIYAQLSPTGS